MTTSIKLVMDVIGLASSNMLLPDDFLDEVILECKKRKALIREHRASVHPSERQERNRLREVLRQRQQDEIRLRQQEDAKR